MDPDALGSFEFDPGTSSDVPRLEQLLDEVSRHASGIDALLLPEAAVTASEISDLDVALEEHGVEVLVAGVGARHGNLVRPELRARRRAHDVVPSSRSIIVITAAEIADDHRETWWALEDLNL